MSVIRYKCYTKAADELKSALVNYVHEVKVTAPELAPQADQMMRSVLTQDAVIFNLLHRKSMDKKERPIVNEGESGR